IPRELPPVEKCIKDPVEIHNIKQRDGEFTKEFMRRYAIECRNVKGAPECMKISQFMHGITNTKLIKRLHDKIPKSVDEMMRVTTAFLIGEVAASNRVRKKSFPSWKQQEAGQKQNFRKGGFRNQQRPERKQVRFTLLTKTPKEIIALDKGKFKPHLPMTTLVEKETLANSANFIGKPGKGRKIGGNLRKGQAAGNTYEEEDGAEGPMIIEAEIGGHFIHRMYVDEGSSLKILYEHCFNIFRPEVRSRMIPATTSLVEFSGEIIWLLGQISLLVKIGDGEHSTSAWMNFMVVRSPSPYNEIIGRPGVRRIQEVPSTTHEMLKFLVAGETVTLWSSRIIPLECTMVSGPGVLQLVINQVAKKRFRPADMTGVLQHIAEHKLSIHEGYLPVRQKKRGQAPERNKAICEEVEKLVDSHIMKEVNYHSWLSNLVMVKKHDGSRRISMPQRWLSTARNRLEGRTLRGGTIATSSDDWVVMVRVDVASIIVTSDVLVVVVCGGVSGSVSKTCYGIMGDTTGVSSLKGSISMSLDCVKLCELGGT
nr:reverse transcriptase domain-containing protein [Tanacetum cinerariifolium]